MFLTSGIKSHNLEKHFQIEIIMRRKMLLNKSSEGCFSNIKLVGLLFLCVPVIVQAVKRCPEMVASGARDSKLNGYYDVVPDQKCYNRDVYLKRGPTNSTKIYLYYYKNSFYSRGWTIAKEPCHENDDRYLHVYNRNRRPDRVLYSWIERDYFGNRRFNRKFDVDCTDGLPYGAILGICFGCIILVAVALPLGIVYGVCGA